MQDSQLFSEFMAKFDFAELTEAGQRVAVSQHILKVARGTFIGLTKQKEENIAADDSIFWLQPLKRLDRDGALEDEEDDAMDIDEAPTPSEYNE